MMVGKFNITKLGKKDQILLGIPWLRAMNPTIDWTKQTISLPATEKSTEIERYVKQTSRPQKTFFTKKFDTKEDVWSTSPLSLTELTDGGEYL
jgi:hypothetical protein